jgi:hypothetical protein
MQILPNIADILKNPINFETLDDPYYIIVRKLKKTRRRRGRFLIFHPQGDLGSSHHLLHQPTARSLPYLATT